MASSDNDTQPLQPAVTRRQTVEEVKEEVKKYTYFNPKLRENAYVDGDIYDKEGEDAAKGQKDWKLVSGHDERPYLLHVKSLSARWPHLRLLADFMEIGTSPVRWKDLKVKGAEAERKERVSRTNVTRLDYFESGKIVPKTYKTSEALKGALNEKTETPIGDDKRNFRLFVVDDLSRDVIEHLGAHYDVEPHFFREHIFDYTWYNTRDRWVDPPRLNLVTKRQRWLQLRFSTARYFRTAESFKKGVEEAGKFNVHRRPEDDLNNKALWDELDAKVGLSRTRISFWLRGGKSGSEESVGILLVDPTIQEGYPLWYGYGNWEKTPSMHEKKYPPGPPRKSLYTDIIYWAQKVDAFGPASTSNPTSNLHIPIQALLYLVASEWLTISEYIKTRLGQIEWEISFPDHFMNKGSSIDVALTKLHVWRRLVPLYREMLTETLQRVFQFPCHTMATTDLDHSITASGAENMAKTSNPPGPLIHCNCPLHNPENKKSGPIGAMREDFARVLAYMEEYQQRIDRLTSVVTAIISIGDSRHSQEDNRNVARLTWLATFFIPLSFVTGLFSMTEDIGTLDQTIKWFFAVALPLASASLGLALVLTLPAVQKWWRKLTHNWFQRGNKKNE